MFFNNINIIMEDWIISNLPDKPIKFNYEIFTSVLDISNYGPRVFEIKNNS